MPDNIRSADQKKYSGVKKWIIAVLENQNGQLAIYLYIKI